MQRSRGRRLQHHPVQRIDLFRRRLRILRNFFLLWHRTDRSISSKNRSSTFISPRSPRAYLITVLELASTCPWGTIADLVPGSTHALACRNWRPRRLHPGTCVWNQRAGKRCGRRGANHYTRGRARSPGKGDFAGLKFLASVSDSSPVRIKHPLAPPLRHLFSLKT